MKKIFISILILVSVQSFGQFKVYGLRLNTNGTVDTIKHKLFSDSLFIDGSFVAHTKEYYDQFFEPEIPAGFGNFHKDADGLYRNFIPFAENAEYVRWDSILQKPSTFTPSAHTHTTSELSNATTIGQNLLSLSTPAENSFIVGLSNGNVISRTAAQAKSDLSIDNVDNTSDANKPISTATQAALDLKQTIPTAGQGLGGTVTQTGNKGNAVTINKQYGQITMNGAALAAAAEVSFTVNNNLVSSMDVVIVNIQSVGTAGSYFVTVGSVSNGSFTITVGNVSTGSLSQALVLNFTVIKSVNN